MAGGSAGGSGGPINRINGSSGLQVFRATVNLLATGQTTLVPLLTGKKFVMAYAPVVRLTARTGALVSAPNVRIGTVAEEGKLITITTLSVDLLTVDDMQYLDNFNLPGSGLGAVDIGSNEVLVDVNVAAVGPSVYAAEVAIGGFIL